MSRYKVHYTADVWQYVVIEADSAKKAQELFETQGEGYDEALEDGPEEMGMENIKVDMVEEIKQNLRIGSDYFRIKAIDLNHWDRSSVTPRQRRLHWMLIPGLKIVPLQTWDQVV